MSPSGSGCTALQCASKARRQLAFIPEIYGHWTLPGPRLGMSQLFRCRDAETQTVSFTEQVSSVWQTRNFLLEKQFHTLEVFTLPGPLCRLSLRMLWKRWTGSHDVRNKTSATKKVLISKCHTTRIMK